MNEVKLQGQITSDPEVKESRNGILRGSFLLTTKGGTEDRPRYDYIRCVIWDEKAQYVVDHFEKSLCLLKEVLEDVFIQIVQEQLLMQWKSIQNIWYVKILAIHSRICKNTHE